MKRVDEGLRAGHIIADRIPFPPTPGEIKAVHFAIFSNIHDFAGLERNEPLRVGFTLAPDAKRLPELMKSLETDSRKDFEATGYENRFYAIAKHHCQEKYIQIFRDGNGRTASTFASSAVKQLTKADAELVFSMEEYVPALMSGVTLRGKLGALGKLTDLFVKASGFENEVQAEHAPIYDHVKNASRNYELLAKGHKSLMNEIEIALNNPDIDKINGMLKSDAAQVFNNAKASKREIDAAECVLNEINDRSNSLESLCVPTFTRPATEKEQTNEPENEGDR